MNVPIDACENGNAAFTLRVGYDGKCYPGNLGTGGGTSQQRPRAWCINSSGGCAGTILAHYHKAGASNIIGTTFSTQETAALVIWEV